MIPAAILPAGSGIAPGVAYGECPIYKPHVGAFNKDRQQHNKKCALKGGRAAELEPDGEIGWDQLFFSLLPCPPVGAKSGSGSKTRALGTAVMNTKKAFASRFSPDEWQLLCSKAEFLEVIEAEPFDLEPAALVAYRILTTASEQPTHQQQHKAHP